MSWVGGNASKLARGWWRAELSVLLLVVCLGLGLAAPTLAAGTRPRTEEPAGIPRCALPDQTALQQQRAKRDQIHVVGNREVNGFGRPWVPYGISVFGGLQDGDGEAFWEPTIKASMAQIEAAPFWHANTVRLQWAESNIFAQPTPGYDVNQDFLEALCAQVQKVRLQGEVAVLNDNTEFPDWGEFNPTQRTEEAWSVIIAEFGNQPGWIADLYNEPRMTLSAALRPRTRANYDWLWRLWQNGGEVNSKQYVGMQELVDYTRQLGFTGTEWIEEPFLEGLRQAWQFPINDPLHNIVWAFHHAALPRSAAKGVTTRWETDFGYLTRKYPVVDAEWNQAAAPRPECVPTAYYAIPAFFRYLVKMHVGLLAWSLQPGSMVAELPRQHLQASNTTHPSSITNPRLLMRPSHMSPDYACSVKRVGQGAGHMILQYFRRYSRT